MSLLSQLALRNSCLRCSSYAYSRTLHVSSRRMKSVQEGNPKTSPGTQQPPPSPPAGTPGKEEFVLGPLTRPLGVQERPTTTTKSTAQKLKDLMDSDVRMAQRRHLYAHDCE